jgi:hypothetical protein
MRHITLLFRTSFSLLLFSGIAAACVIVPKLTVLEAYNQADVVIVARAISITKVDDKEPVPLNTSRVLTTTMEVQKVYKGNLKVGDKITFGQGNGIRCTQVFDEDVVGTEYVFYLERPPAGETLWYELRNGLEEIS